jgi:hypothetical protein
MTRLFIVLASLFMTSEVQAADCDRRKFEPARTIKTCSGYKFEELGDEELQALGVTRNLFDQAYRVPDGKIWFIGVKNKDGTDLNYSEWMAASIFPSRKLRDQYRIRSADRFDVQQLMVWQGAEPVKSSKEDPFDGFKAEIPGLDKKFWINCNFIEEANVVDFRGERFYRSDITRDVNYPFTRERHPTIHILTPSKPPADAPKLIQQVMRKQTRYYTHTYENWALEGGKFVNRNRTIQIPYEVEVWVNEE